MTNMTKNWIAISGSPRRHKNTETLMNYYMDELERHGRKVEKVI
ncbi:NAD(P)H-dependent oxidoreductase [Clostridium sp. Cult3]|nr:NAD(P)H-dependent oxidoreductase [Clostridium sp. Cult3]